MGHHVAKHKYLRFVTEGMDLTPEYCKEHGHRPRAYGDGVDERGFAKYIYECTICEQRVSEEEYEAFKKANPKKLANKRWKYNVAGKGVVTWNELLQQPEVPK